MISDLQDIFPTLNQQRSEEVRKNMLEQARLNGLAEYNSLPCSSTDDKDYSERFNQVQCEAIDENLMFDHIVIVPSQKCLR